MTRPRPQTKRREIQSTRARILVSGGAHDDTQADRRGSARNRGCPHGSKKTRIWDPTFADRSVLRVRAMRRAAGLFLLAFLAGCEACEEEPRTGDRTPPRVRDAEPEDVGF